MLEDKGHASCHIGRIGGTGATSHAFHFNLGVPTRGINAKKLSGPGRCFEDETEGRDEFESSSAATMQHQLCPLR